MRRSAKLTDFANHRTNAMSEPERVAAVRRALAEWSATLNVEGGDHLRNRLGDTYAAADRVIELISSLTKQRDSRSAARSLSELSVWLEGELAERIADTLLLLEPVELALHERSGPDDLEVPD